MSAEQGTSSNAFDVVIVGAGFAGMYMLHRMRQAGFSAVVLEAADDVGGTWYWNRYPGARCDIPTTDYTLGFDPELEASWTWSEKYATQPEILRYAQHVAEFFGLRPDIRFNTKVTAAKWDDDARTWSIGTDTGDTLAARYYVMATGCLSVPKTPDIPGQERFAGETYYTSTWPHDGVDFTGKRVGVIGTGSSGIQSIPLIAEQAAEMVVFQRTPNFSIPARNGPAPEDRLERIAADRDTYRHDAKWSRGGVPLAPTEEAAAMLSDEQQRERFEAGYATGELFGILGVFADQGVNPETNEIVSEMLREKIRSRVDDPAVAELLCPTDHPFGSKRPCLDTNYYETYNLPHVSLVDLRSTPIETITETGIQTAAKTYEFDAIVYATGFDAMTGAIVGVDITGTDGVTLKDKWAHGPETYLGLMSVGFPNLFMITGPGSPSVLSNMAVSIEQHVDWIADRLIELRDAGFDRIEPTEHAEEMWGIHVQDCAGITLHPIANSWYMGANVPGKPRVFLPYIGGVDAYRGACDEVATEGMLGFDLSGPNGEQRNDGAVRRLQPDVKMMLDMMAELNPPKLWDMDAPSARAFNEAMAEVRPPGPEVAELVDGTYPAGDGTELNYRLYRPEGAGPHPIVCYFHGGGWVLGHATSDEPFIRDMCVRTNAVWISMDYRHAPEHVLPAAAEDAVAAVNWVADHAIELGGIPGQLVVAGWSAGGNLAAIAAQAARDAGSPEIVGQMLLTPVTDSDMTRGSYVDNGADYVLTAEGMDWFWNHYEPDTSKRTGPLATPLREKLDGLPPAVITTAEFDPLRDEGDAYADALAAAGVPVTHIRARGHIHTSIPMVGVVLTGATVRDQMAEAVTKLFTDAPIPA